LEPDAEDGAYFSCFLGLTLHVIRHFSDELLPLTLL
jgi:hypothetical protein